MYYIDIFFDLYSLHCGKARRREDDEGPMKCCGLGEVFLMSVLYQEFRMWPQSGTDNKRPSESRSREIYMLTGQAE